MAGSLNKVLLIGNLGRDPEIRYTQDGRPIANFTIATSENWKNAQGERQERTEWHRVVVFSKAAEFIQQYLRKGSKVYVEGQLQTRKWTDNQNQERYTTEVVVSAYNGQVTFLDSRPGGGAPRQDEPPPYGENRSQGDTRSQGGQDSRGAPPPSREEDFGRGPDLDDDIPF